VSYIWAGIYINFAPATKLHPRNLKSLLPYRVPTPWHLAEKSRVSRTVISPTCKSCWLIYADVFCGTNSFSMCPLYVTFPFTYDWQNQSSPLRPKSSFCSHHRLTSSSTETPHLCKNVMFKIKTCWVLFLFLFEKKINPKKERK